MTNTNLELFSSLKETTTTAVKSTNVKKAGSDAVGKLSAIVNSIRKDDSFHSTLLRKMQERKDKGQPYNPEVYNIVNDKKRFYAFVCHVINVHPRFHYLSAKVRRKRVTGSQIGGLVQELACMPADLYTIRYTVPVGYMGLGKEEDRRGEYISPGFNNLLNQFEQK